MVSSIATGLLYATILSVIFVATAVMPLMNLESSGLGSFISIILILLSSVQYVSIKLDPRKRLVSWILICFPSNLVDSSGPLYPFIFSSANC
ncbi:hypothetical protein F4779DRAFT_590999 [Xylariaceae sp. FL0662B]|nr:hypothetical protein F4779DRAFT_590999 [Xylariaceae sp. FL0662B]